jgi:Conjugative transposon protein TcpC
MREGPRCLLAALAVSGLAASARYAVDPPRAASAPAPLRVPSLDRSAEAFAVLFTRRFLTWNAAEPSVSSKGLEPYVSSGMEPAAGLVLPALGTETVEWAEVAQQREPSPGTHVYTIAAQTRPGGLQYLTVTVTRQAGGGLSLSGYPAFVGPPAFGDGRFNEHLRSVSDGALTVVVRRALSNYLIGSSADLAADLTASAQVSLPLAPLRPVTIQAPDWAPGGGAVLVTVQAEGGGGVRYTLSYEMDVTLVEGRWEISAIQTDPDD